MRDGIRSFHERFCRLFSGVPKRDCPGNISNGKGATFSRTELGWVLGGFQPLGAHIVKPTRTISPPGMYFVNFTTLQWRTLFVVENYARLFLKTLYGYRRQEKFALHAFVVMPDHVHLLITPARDVTIERAVQLIKGGYSHAVGVEISRREIWQKGFTDHRIRDANDFAGHRVYIHKIRWWRDWLRMSASIGIRRHFRDSSWTCGPQRLKPRSAWALNGATGSRTLPIRLRPGGALLQDEQTKITRPTSHAQNTREMGHPLNHVPPSDLCSRTRTSARTA